MSAQRVAIRIDPSPCNRYRWSGTACRGTHSGAHACAYPGGHNGACKCFYCDKRGAGNNVADTPTPTKDTK